MSVSQYVGRTIDLLIWDGIKPRGETQLTPTLAEPGGGGKIVSGIQKLVQKFLKFLLQETGTKTYAPTEGTRFVTRIRMGQVRTSLDVQQAFASALVDVKRQLTATYTPATPADEKLGSAELLAAYLTGTSVILHIELVSLAGTAYTFLQPLTVSPSSRYNSP